MGIDLNIPAGQFYSLLGASGCGKTTTLRMIAGFEKPDSGRIELDGRDVAGDPPHKRPVNTVFQTYALFPFMTVWDNVAFGRALVLRPRVLLLDEPLGALDAKLRKQLQLELRAVQREVGITFVYVTHDQEEALTMSDQIAVLAEGRCAQPWTPGSAPRSTPRQYRVRLQSSAGRSASRCRIPASQPDRNATSLVALCRRSSISETARRYTSMSARPQR